MGDIHRHFFPISVLLGVPCIQSVVLDEQLFLYCAFFSHKSRDLATQAYALGAWLKTWLIHGTVDSIRSTLIPESMEVYYVSNGIVYNVLLDRKE